MEPGQEQLYGQYRPFEHEKFLVLDKELDLYAPLDYVIPSGSSNRVYQTISSSTNQSVSQANFTLQTTLETLLNTQPLFRGTVNVSWPSGVTVSKADVIGSIFQQGGIFLRQFPIARACNNLQFLIGGTSLTLNTQAVLPVMMKCYRNLNKNRSLGITATFPDTNAVYYPVNEAATGFSSRLPNSQSLNLPYDECARNIQDFNWNFIETSTPGPNCLGFSVTLLEAPFLDIFSLVRDGKKCLSGLNNYQWIYNFQAPTPSGTSYPTAYVNTSPLANLFSIVPNVEIVTSTGLTTVDQLFATCSISWASIPQLLTIQYSQNTRFNNFNAYSYPYLDISSGYQTQTVTPTSIPQSTVDQPYPQVLVGGMSMNSVTVSQIPKMFIIWVSTNPSFVNSSVPDWMLVPQTISLRLGNNQNLLSSAQPHELFQLSVKNGLCMTWSLAQQIGYPLILLPTDLGLTSDLLVEGVLGSFQLEIQTMTALTPSTLVNASTSIPLNNLQVQMIPAYSCELQIVNNRANLVSVTGVDAASVPNMKFIDTGNWEQDSPLRGGSIGSFFKKVWSGFRKVAPVLRPIVEGVSSFVSDLGIPKVSDVAKIVNQVSGSELAKKVAGGARLTAAEHKKVQAIVKKHMQGGAPARKRLAYS